MKLVCLLLILLSLSEAYADLEGKFMEQFPHLESLTYEKPASHIYYGFGMSPVSVMESKIYIAANFMQIHWIKGIWDVELFSSSVGMTITQNDYSSSKHFVFRASPKIRVFGIISIGRLIGIEFIRFSNVTARFHRNRFVTPFDTFTTKGGIWGLMLSETIRYKDSDEELLKINQVVYKQGYSTKEATTGWEILYQNEELADAEKMKEIEAGWVFMLEFALLF